MLDLAESAARLENAERRAIVWDGDGVESSVALADEQTGYAFIVNGKSDGSALGDAGTQVMLGLIGALQHPQPRRALVIGLGTGSSAGWLGAIPSMERVDVVELEPLVLDVARACAPVNHDVHAQPEGSRDDRRRPRAAADDARSLRRHRVGAVESVSRRHRQPVHRGVLPRRRTIG